MGNISETQYFQAVQDKKMEVSDVLEQVYIALTEKGYIIRHSYPVCTD